MLNVLIVDDQELIRESLEIIINNEADMQVIGCAQDGYSGVRLALEKFPDVVLMDIRMPDINGTECIKLIKEKKPELPIVVLTTFNDDEYVYQSLKNGASGYMLKNSSSRDMVQAIKTAAEGGALINPDIAVVAIRFFSKMANASFSNSEESILPDTIQQNEIKIIRSIGRGLSNKEIAYTMHLSEGTVRNYISSILKKLGLRDRTQIAIYAVQNGLTVDIHSASP